jgi:hypothetical protein
MEASETTFLSTYLRISRFIVAGQRLGKRPYDNEYTRNNKITVQRGVFQAVRVESNTQYIVKRKHEILFLLGKRVKLSE